MESSDTATGKEQASVEDENAQNSTADPDIEALADDEPESDRYEVVAATDPETDAKRRKKTPAKSAGKEAPSAGPSKQEVLTRLLEKNEVILQLTKKNAELEAVVKSLEESRLRQAAEYDNYRKRTRKEWDLLKQQTRAEVILEVLNVIDDFERAFAAAPEGDSDFVQGIRLIYSNLVGVLERFGVSRMEAEGALFDPNYHMAVAHIDSKETESNHVVEVVQAGYLLGDTVIRPAKVVIAK